MKLPTVTVLLSTYNGEKYISDLLESILKQTYPDINIYVRDDGSEDSTCEILHQYCRKYNNIEFVKGDNVGSARSFLELLKISPESDYFAFADQDDVWLPDKITKGIELLVENNANLYHSNYQLTDKDLFFLETPSKPRVETIGQAAVLYPCTGCTMIISKKLRDLVNSYNPEFLVMHDAWIFKIAVCVGNPIVFDNNSYILYRQHGNNVLGGIRQNIFKRIISKVKVLFHSNKTRSKEMKELYKGFKLYMDNQTKSIVENLAFYESRSLLKRIIIAVDKKFISSQKNKDLFFKLAIVFKKY